MGYASSARTLKKLWKKNMKIVVGNVLLGKQQDNRLHNSAAETVRDHQTALENNSNTAAVTAVNLSNNNLHVKPDFDVDTCELKFLEIFENGIFLEAREAMTPSDTTYENASQSDRTWSKNIETSSETAYGENNNWETSSVDTSGMDNRDVVEKQSYGNVVVNAAQYNNSSNISSAYYRRDQYYVANVGVGAGGTAAAAAAGNVVSGSNGPNMIGNHGIIGNNSGSNSTLTSGIRLFIPYPNGNRLQNWKRECISVSTVCSWEVIMDEFEMLLGSFEDELD